MSFTFEAGTAKQPPRAKLIAIYGPTKWTSKEIQEQIKGLFVHWEYAGDDSYRLETIVWTKLNMTPKDEEIANRALRRLRSKQAATYDRNAKT
jgi:hypothetical protein